MSPVTLPSEKELNADILARNQMLEALHTGLTRSEQRLKDAQNSVRNQEEAIRRAEREMYKQHDLLLVVRGVDPDVLKMRDAIVAKTARAESKRISVGSAEKLCEDVEALKEAIVKQCPHTFVLSYDGDPGSQSYDYSDAYPGIRRCIVCGFMEICSSRTADTHYQTLREQPSVRMIVRDLRSYRFNDHHGIGHCGDFRRRFEWEPLSFYLDMFALSAGSMNAIWPEEKNNQTAKAP